MKSSLNQQPKSLSTQDPRQKTSRRLLKPIKCLELVFQTCRKSKSKNPFQVNPVIFSHSRGKVALLTANHSPRSKSNRSHNRFASHILFTPPLIVPKISYPYMPRNNPGYLNHVVHGKIY